MKARTLAVCLAALALARCALVARPPAPKGSVVVTPTVVPMVPMPQGPQTCAGVGTPCASGNPGACNAGHIICASGVATCKPDVESQPCYSGAPGTEAHGPCKGGTQACIGTLGACVGEVTPQPEDCFNTIDDDCDGTVNSGCPDQLTLGAPRPLDPQGGVGGTARSARCPAGAFVTRAQVLFDDTDGAVAGVNIYCGTPTLAVGNQGFTLGIAPVAPAPYDGFVGTSAGKTTTDANCGGVGLVAGFTVKGRADANGVFGLGVYCAAAAASFGSDNKLTIKLSASASGNYSEYPYGTSFTSTCADDEVLVGFDGHTSGWLVRIQPICAPLSATYK
jgi:hypothetical protein